MGMKRRGLGRRQVLNLNDKQDSPRRTWQTKYQQICAEHNSQNGDSQDAAVVHADKITSTSSKNLKSNPLSGLVGQYHSDSDTEDDSRKDEDQLNSKVSDFLKEIQTIAPAEYVATSPGPQVSQQPKEAEVLHPHLQPQLHHTAVLAWQECYDETSGYVYYWNMETNEVTWEMPPEYQAYMAAMAAQEQHMGMMHSAAQAQAQALAHAHAHAQAAMEPDRGRLLHAPKGQESPEPSRKKGRPKDVDSDDERIEMITSYGPASDEETDDDDDDDDDDDLPPPVKRRRGSPVKSKHTVGTSVVSSKWPEPPVMGPMNEVGTMMYVNSRTNLQEENGEEPVEGLEFEGSTLLSNDVPDMGAPGEEDFRDQESTWSPGGTVIMKSTELSEMQMSDTLGSNVQEGPYPIPDSSEDNSISDKGADVAKVSCLKTSMGGDSASVDDNVLTYCRVSQLKAEELEQSEELVAGSGTSTPVATTTEGESDDVESGETDEGVILSRLRSQARILKELGGEIPDEIQHLIEPATSDALPIVVEDVIAQIEKELPPDYIGEDKDTSISCKKKLHSGGVSIETSPRPSSFALIAGYGDDSDPEDEKKPKRTVKISNESKKSRLLAEQAKLETNTLVPIADQNISQKVKLKLSTDETKIEPTPIFPIADQTGTQKRNFNLSTEQSKVEISSVFPISDQPLSQKEMLKLSTEQVNVETSLSTDQTLNQKAKLHTVVHPMSVTPKESNLGVGPVSNVVLEDCTSHDISSLPYTPLFPTAIVTNDVPESTRSVEPCSSEPLLLDSTNLPDSTTSNKIIKRKKRLDLGGVFPVAKAATASIVPEAESKKRLNDGSVYTLTKPATTTGMQITENKNRLDEGGVYSIAKATTTTTVQVAESKKCLNEGGIYSSAGTTVPTPLQLTENKVHSDDIGVSSVAKATTTTTVQVVAESKNHLDESAVYFGAKAATTTMEQVADSKKCMDEDVHSVSKVAVSTMVQGSESKCEKSRAGYSTWTSYNSDPASGERRGFGFQSMQDGNAVFFLEETPKPAVKQKKGIINFVKAETLNPITKDDQEVKPVVRGELLGVSKEEIEAHQHMDEMALLISEKVSFLAEGKEPVSPVQVMAIQIETLVSAWQAGALARPYWSHWLANTTGELARLEQVAAPDGWACEWDREYKRYYYRNELSGETQWEYPSTPEEDAMELCTTPPPPPAIVEEEPPRTPPAPPPPLISASPSPPPPLPPRISPYPEKNNSKSSSQNKKKRRTDGEVTSTSSDMTKEVTGGSTPASTYALPNTSAPVLPPLPPLPPPPPPPPPSELPPLPPSSPPPSVPSPPLPTSPPPPSMHCHDIEHGEPLPPGVDPPELPYIVARPPMPNSSSFQNAGTVGPPPPPPGEDVFAMPMPAMSPSPPDSTALEVSQMMADDSMVMGAMPHPLQGQFVMSSSYQQAPVVSSSIPGMSIEYGPVPYMTAMPMHMAMPAVIAKPPAKKSKSSLHDELDSFYSDLASLESTGSIPPATLDPPIEPAPAEVTTLPAASYEPGTSAFSESEPTSKAADTHVVPVFSETRRKKKPKLAPGLALKKKGVSSLVAKWQQVQQEVRRDYKSLDDDDGGVSSTHK